MKRIRRGDQVQVVAGREKGKRGEVVRLVDGGERVVVRGLNLVTRHVRPTQANPKGGIVRQEAALHASNVMPVDPQDGKPCRLGARERDGVMRRVSRRTGAVIGG